MENLSLEIVTLITGIALLLIGIWGLLTQKNLIKMVIGFALFDTGIHIIMVSIGYVKNRTAPILDQAVKTNENKVQIRFKKGEIQLLLSDWELQL